MKLFGKILIGVFIGAVFIICAGSAVAATTSTKSAIIPECLLANNIQEMKSANCDNLNIFIWLAINIGKYLFTFIGALALLFFVYGGFVLIMSQGNQEKIKQGTGAMVAAVVGLIIAFSAYALVTFIGNTIGLKAEKSLNFIQPAMAVTPSEKDNQVKTCIYEDGCWCADDRGCWEMMQYEECWGNLTKDFCESFETIDPVLQAELLKEKVGEKKETDDVSAVVKAAQKLNPMNIGKPTDLFSRAINAMLAFIGSIVLVLYIYAGFLWMASSGNAEQIKKAQNILIWTTLGAIAMAGSYMIVRTILEKIG
jgi:hypothetical protein